MTACFVMSMWPKVLRERALVAGYGNVLFGRGDVEGTDEKDDSLCLDNHVRGNKLYRNGRPILYTLLDELGIPWCSASCHWVSLDRGKMTDEQKQAIAHCCSWVCERWMDKHHPGCPRLHNLYAKCHPSCEAERDR